MTRCPHLLLSLNVFHIVYVSIPIPRLRPSCRNRTLAVDPYFSWEVLQIRHRVSTPLLEVFPPFVLHSIRIYYIAIKLKDLLKPTTINPTMETAKSGDAAVQEGRISGVT